MRKRWLGVLSPVVLVAMIGCGEDVPNPVGDGGRRDSGGGGVDGGGGGTDAYVPPPCVDTDMDGIADNLENGDTDMDGIPDSMDPDSDGDGIPDIDEAVGNYTGVMPPRPTLVCGITADDCDGDGRPNFRDLDSDNDGLSDAEERMAGTNSCAEDSDMDGVPDLTERVTGSNPADPASMPPTGSLYVTLPYHPPAEMGPHVQRRFTFQTRIRAADVFFLVDTTGSMGATIAAVQSSLMRTIVPGIVSAIGPMGNIRYGLAAHGDFDRGGSNPDGCVRVHQRLTPNAALVQTATGRLAANGGGDGPESQMPAMHALIEGSGHPLYYGTATRRMDPVRDCGMAPDEPTPYGWGCFLPGRVPIMVLFSDAPWHNGPGLPNNYSFAVPVYSDLQREMVARGAYFIGIDVGGGSTQAASTTLARATMTFDGMGQPITFRGAPATVAANVVSAITTIAGQSRQDITTRTDPDRMEMRLPMGRTTAEFLRSVTPVGATPEAPAGYARRDMTTFYNVSPDAIVEFEVDFYNDFQPGGTAATLYRATIVVLGRAMSEVDRRDVFIIVPANTAQPPIG